LLFFKPITGFLYFDWFIVFVSLDLIGSFIFNYITDWWNRSWSFREFK